MVVTPYVIPNRGPYPFDQPKRWVVRLECASVCVCEGRVGVC